jgi:TPR repeat protein
MRLKFITLLFSCCLGLRAQSDFAICRDAGPEILRQKPASSPQTEFCIGYLYASGRGVPKDMSAAGTHFRAAAEKGYTPAQAVLGVNYAKGIGVAQNWTEAVFWFRKAMIGGHAGAAVNLGQCFQNGNGVPRDDQEAARLYRFAAAHGDPTAAGLLAKLDGSPPAALFGGTHPQAAAPANQVPQNYAMEQDKISWCTYRVPPERVSQLLSEVRSCYVRQPGTVTCQGNLTGNYGQIEVRATPPIPKEPQGPQTFPIPSTPPPMGVPSSQRGEADQLWQRAAALLDRDDARGAMPVLYRCALMGDARAEATLGIRYQDGDGVNADDHAAAYWFGLAATQGHRASQYALGGMYLEGEGGLKQDLAKATELLIKSANQGYDKAQLALGISYEFGEGVPRDRAKAIALIKQSSLANEIASVLASPRTPKSFASEDAFGAYLSSLRNAQISASWAQSRVNRGPWSGEDGYFNHNSGYWQNRRHQESLEH